MINIIKEDAPYLYLKEGVIEPNTAYDILIDGHERTMMSPEPINNQRPYSYKTSFIHLMNVLSKGDEIKPHPVYSYNRRREPVKMNITESISFVVDDIFNGRVKMKKHGDAEWMRPEVFVDKDTMKSIDTDKIKPGQLWKLTIDGDPRFQNTLIMIIPCYWNALRFIYQTNVLYPDGYNQTETSEGNIELYDRNENLIDISKVHLTLVKDCTNPEGSSLDRTNEDKFIYPTSYNIGYKEAYPEIKPRKREIIDDDCDGYDDKYYDD